MEHLHIGNEGKYLADTNYWSSQLAKLGQMYMSFNAGAARLLVPSSRLSHVADMTTAKYVIMTRGLFMPIRTEAIELLFEDDSDSPWVVTMGIEECDRAPAEADRGRTFPFLIYTPNGLVAETTVRYRRVPTLPCLKPWR